MELLPVLQFGLMRTAGPKHPYLALRAFLNMEIQGLQSSPCLQTQRATLIYLICHPLLSSAQHLSQLDSQLLCFVCSRCLVSVEHNFITTNKEINRNIEMVMIKLYFTSIFHPPSFREAHEISEKNKKPLFLSLQKLFLPGKQRLSGNLDGQKDKFSAVRKNPTWKLNLKNILIRRFHIWIATQLWIFIYLGLNRNFLTLRIKNDKNINGKIVLPY